MRRNTGKTSLNQVPEGMKKVKHWPGELNFDYGGGKYDKASNWLWEEKRVHNLVYDIHNRSDRENIFALRLLHECKSFSCFNVLNVMQDFKERLEVYHLYKRMMGLPVAFFSIYEGSRSGTGGQTSKGWQNNLIKSFYVTEINEVFSHGYDVMHPLGLIVVKKLEPDPRTVDHQVQRLYGGL